MDVHTNIPLKNYTTMRLGGSARFMTDVHSVEDIQAIANRANEQKLPLFVLGGGSNTIVRDEGFNGIVVRNRIKGYDIIEDTPDYTTIRVGGGENWDETVKKNVDAHLSGIEALSAIPGTVGAAPVQNIGAYGQEVGDVIVSVDAYDLVESRLVQLSASDCGFSYRHSVFRGKHAGRYVITAVTMRLSKTPPQPPFYAAVQNYLDEHNITIITPATIRETVAAIRQEKLPDPSQLPNSGSFFKNAVIDDWQYKDLLETYPDMPSYDMPENRHKIPTGWLIEKVGLKGAELHGMKVHDKNALVLINQSASSYSDLAAARDTIRGKVRDTFRITIEQEPLEL